MLDKDAKKEKKRKKTKIRLGISEKKIQDNAGWKKIKRNKV